MRTVTCANMACGIEYAIPEHVYAQGVAHGAKRSVFCPNGHSWHFTESEEDRLRKKVAELETSLQRSRALVQTLEDDVTIRERRERNLRGLVTRLKKQRGRR